MPLTCYKHFTIIDIVIEGDVMLNEKAQSLVENVRRGMRNLASGVSIATTVYEGKWHGLVVTSLSSVCFQPVPMLLVCVNKTASSHDCYIESGALAISVLGEHSSEIAACFATQSRRHERFKIGDWSVMKTGAPVLRGSLARFDCRIRQTIPVGTHTIMLSEIVAAETIDVSVVPLLYFNGSYASLTEPKSAS